MFWLREFGNGVDCERPIAYLSLDAPVAVFDRLYANFYFHDPLSRACDVAGPDPIDPMIGA